MSDIADIIAGIAKLDIPVEVCTHWGWGKLAWVTNRICGTKFEPLELKAEVLRGLQKAG